MSVPCSCPSGQNVQERSLRDLRESRRLRNPEDVKSLRSFIVVFFRSQCFYKKNTCEFKVSE